MRKIFISILLSLLVIGMSFPLSVNAEGSDTTNDEPAGPRYTIIQKVVDRTITHNGSYIHITGTYDVINNSTVQNINLTYTASAGVSASFAAGSGNVTAYIVWLDSCQIVIL